MNFKRRLLFLLLTVIPFCYIFLNAASKHTPLPGPPFVDGWSQNTSRNASDYISETLVPHIMPKHFCNKEALLLVIVNIRPDNFEARDVIRETWAQKNENISFYFLMGEDKAQSYELKLRLQQESQQHNDIIQERFIDSYNNLTIKTITMLKLFTLHCSKSYKYLLKIDDDVFLNVPNLLQFLGNQSSDKDLLVGKLINETKPFRDPSSKWYVPYELYPEEKYPDYLCGPSYVMSAKVAENLYHCALETPIFFIEDAHITGTCAKKINVVPKHHPMFTCNELNKYVCLHRNVYTLHYYKPKEIRKSFRILSEKKCPKPGSFMEWIFSIF